MTRAQALMPYRSPFHIGDAAAQSAPSVRWSREWIYFACIMVAWCFTPLLRRLLDYRNGAFNPVQITSLIPFLMLLPLVFACLKKERMARLTPPLRVLVYVWCGTFAYGFVIAAAFGNISAAAFEMLQYLVPMLAGIWLAGQELGIAESMRRLAVIILPSAGIVAVYGVAQWVAPAPWDVMWVEGSHFTGADSPVPFGMRIFSTLNSPGTTADFFAVTLIFALPFLRLRSLWAWPLVAAFGGAILLTLVREAWVAAVVGAVVYLIASPKRLTAVPSIALFGAVLVALVISLPALLGSSGNSDVITSRISTFGDVGHDASALARQTEISDALVAGLNNPLGSGLGNIGAAARLGSNSQSELGNVLDSGYLARFIELGWLGCAGYILVVVGGPVMLLLEMLGGGMAAKMSTEAKIAAATALAIAVALAWGDAASDAHLGLEGLFFWIALGLGSLALRPDVASAPAPRAQPVFGRLRRSV